MNEQQFSYEASTPPNNPTNDTNNNDCDSNCLDSSSLNLFLDFVDLVIDEEALMKLVSDLGLDSDKFELPDLKNVHEAISLSCSR